MLFLVMLSNVCVSTEHDKDVVPNEITESKLRSYFKYDIDMAVEMNPESKVEIEYFLIDLNDDGFKDVIVTFDHAYFCSGLYGAGCKSVVLVSKCGELINVFTIMNNDGIEVKNEMVNNYKVLVVNENEFVFNVNKYEPNQEQ